MTQNPWSQWHDFNLQTVGDAPETPGVFVMHVAMKILYIGGSANIRDGLMQALRMPCCSNATRFKYMQEPNYLQHRDDLVRDYRERHEGNLPACM